MKTVRAKVVGLTEINKITGRDTFWLHKSLQRGFLSVTGIAGPKKRGDWRMSFEQCLEAALVSALIDYSDPELTKRIVESELPAMVAGQDRFLYFTLQREGRFVSLEADRLRTKSGSPGLAWGLDEAHEQMNRMGDPVSVVTALDLSKIRHDVERVFVEG